jgi:hypothetical protein
MSSRDQSRRPVTEQTFAQGERLGVSSRAAREDHSHGTPDNPFVALADMLGSSLSYSGGILDTIQAIHSGAVPVWAGIRITSLTDGFIPKHTSDATGLEDSLLQHTATGIKIGTGAAGVDYTFEVDGQTNDGLWKWMEDEDYWQYEDDVLMYGAEKVYFRDMAVGIYSQADSFLDLFADGGFRIGNSSAGAPTNYTKFDPDGTISFTGTSGIVLPHMMQSDSTDQAIANTALAQVITFDTDVHHNLITRTSSSRFTITKAGSYLITFSGVAICGTAGKRIEVWLRINGSDVDSSNTVYTFKSANANTVVAVSFLVHFAVDDYFEFWTWGDDTGAKWDATAAAAGPVRPACPSIIITANYIGKD